MVAGFFKTSFPTHHNWTRIWDESLNILQFEGAYWRIIPFSKYPVTMVIVSPQYVPNKYSAHFSENNTRSLQALEYLMKNPEIAKKALNFSLSVLSRGWDGTQSDAESEH